MPQVNIVVKKSRRKEMKLIRNIILAAVVLLLCPMVNAANKETGKSTRTSSLSDYEDNKPVQLALFNYGDSISALWIPVDQSVFRQGVEKGYRLERRQRMPDGSYSQWQAVSASLKPYTKARFVELEKQDENAAVMNELIYQDAQRSGEIPADPDADNAPQSGENDENEMEPAADDQSDDDILFNLGITNCILDKELLLASGLYCTDKQIDRAATYEYRVVFADGTDNSLCTARQMVAAEKTVLPKLSGLAGNFYKKKVHLKLPIGKLTDSYASFRLETSTDSVHYYQVNKHPLVYSYADSATIGYLMASDTLADDNVHYYRMVGYSPFGLYGKPSNVVKGKRAYVFNVEVLIDTIRVDKKNVAHLQWKVSGAIRKIKAFNIYRADSPNNQMQLVNRKPLSAKTLVYADKSSHRNNYYIVSAIDNKGNKVNSFPYYAFQIDSIPPLAPVGLSGTIDSAGVARIKWNPNKEDDILGYRVFFSNHKDFQYLSRTDTLLNVAHYNDTLSLNTLTNEIYYKVQAVDRNYNQSKLSEAVRLSKPDTIAPVKAVFVKAEKGTDGFVLQWENSTSEDLAKVELLRVVDNKPALLLASYDKEHLKNTFTDTSSVVGEIRYFIKSYDMVGNCSVEVSIPVYIKDETACLVKVTAAPDMTKPCVVLDWEKKECNFEKFCIFRKDNGGKAILITTVDGAQRRWVDHSIQVGNAYQYMIKAVASEGIYIRFSNLVKF